MIIAVIDMGTNTFNILIRETDSNEVLFADKISVRLGDGGINDNIIADAAFERGIKALHELRSICEKWKVEEIYAYATSAVRSAGNGKQFTDTVKAETGINVNVIDGDKEAELIYLGVQQAVEISDGNALIMDIGGGSTEFILTDKEGVIWKKSYLLGASRVMEKFRPSDPIRNEEIETLEAYFENELQDLIEICNEKKVNQLIGSSGSFDTLAAMVAHKFQSPDILEGKTSYTFDIYEYKQIARQMLESDFEQRLRTPGMIPMRADLIVIACVQINFILKRLGIKSMKSSVFALKEGVFETLKNKEQAWQRSLL